MRNGCGFMQNDFVLVPMDEIIVSNATDTMIGTNGLATSMGILLYAPSKKRALLYHASTNKSGSSPSDEASSIFALLCKKTFEYHLSNEQFKYLVIVGHYLDQIHLDKAYHIRDELLKYFAVFNQQFSPFLENDLSYDAIKLHHQTHSLEFVFDADSGQFITNAFFPNDIDFDIYKNEKRKRIDI